MPRHGGEDGGRDTISWQTRATVPVMSRSHHRGSAPLRPSLPDFVQSLLTVSSVQLARAAGFSRGDSSSISALTRTAATFMAEVAALAKSFAELSGRQRPNAADIAAALEDYGESLTELRDFLDQSDALPFFHSALPSFPLVRAAVIKVQPSPIATMDDAELPQLPSHIPDYLPPFPDLVTYQATPAPVEAAVDADAVRRRKFEQSRAVEHGLVEIQAAMEKKQSDDDTAQHFGALSDVHTNGAGGGEAKPSMSSQSMQYAGDPNEDENPFTRPPDPAEVQPASRAASLTKSQSLSQTLSAPSPVLSPTPVKSEALASITTTNSSTVAPSTSTSVNDTSYLPPPPPDAGDQDIEIEI